MLDAVAERRVRGTVERTYVLRAAPPVSPDDLEGFVSLVQPYMNNSATPDRRRRILRTIVLPAPDSNRSAET